nr:hypothetical protein [Saccharopolyspora spinosa]
MLAVPVAPAAGEVQHLPHRRQQIDAALGLARREVRATAVEVAHQRILPDEHRHPRSLRALLVLGSEVAVECRAS